MQHLVEDTSTSRGKREVLAPTIDGSWDTNKEGLANLPAIWRNGVNIRRVDF
jgi:hypothetical protein